jgi:hypothetical protein
MIFNYLDYSKPSKDLLLDLIERSGVTEVRREELVFSNPINLGESNTGIKVSGNAASGLLGNIDLTYNRIQLDYIFFGHQLLIETDDAITKEMISSKIKTNWNVLIETTDFNIAFTELEQLPVRVTVSASPNSLVWVGSFEVWVLRSNNLSTIFKNQSQSLGNNTKFSSAYIYSMEKTFAPLTPDLLFSVNTIFFTIDTVTQPLLDYLTLNTGDTWTIDPNIADFNLHNAEVIYVDANKLVINLSPKCKNLIGYLVIHF